MSAKKRALGRGLDSLIGPLDSGTPDAPEISPFVSSASAVAAEPGRPMRHVLELGIAEVRPNLSQPRFVFHEENIKELADSIREKGILQPLLVLRRDDHYELIAGERRFRAAQSIGMQTVPCLVMHASDEEAFEMSLIENLHREDLNAIEEARSYQSLMDRFHLTQEEVSKRVGKSRPAVANSLRLMNLPLDIQEDIIEDRLTAGHARAILQVPETIKQRALRNLIVAKGLSVREAEAQARRMSTKKPPSPPKPATVDTHIRSLQETFSMKIGLPVLIRAVATDAGRVEIQYHSLEDFEIISDFFGVEKT